MKKKIKICIVRSLYNDTSKLLQSAIKELKKRKILFKIIEVPGAFEIPVVLARNIKKMILVTRSKKKVIGLDGYGIKIIKQEIIK